ncbi:MAG TPA: pyrroline-5-carboxylate reductase dimerization domain-containing protein, partial [Candidatus Hydrogenedentes bacterium]|nr:pyrroline-5-carboxylate reductase dimerization domain-containing protein [Candidatus Hydrogenedentota bacterium]
NPACLDADREVALGIFQAVGVAVVVREEQLDAVTALSGSGPAYYFFLTELLIRAGVAEGLEPETARLLAIHTAMGAGRMLVESGESPETLREKVTSKGGTTFAALEAFRAGGFENLVLQAVHAAAERSRELGGQTG